MSRSYSMYTLKPEFGKTFTAFGIIFILGFVGLFAVKQNVYYRQEKIRASRARIAQAREELSGKESKIWYFTEDYKEYRRKKELESKQKQQKEQVQ